MPYGVVSRKTGHVGVRGAVGRRRLRVLETDDIVGVGTIVVFAAAEVELEEQIAAIAGAVKQNEVARNGSEIAAFEKDLRVAVGEMCDVVPSDKRKFQATMSAALRVPSLPSVVIHPLVSPLITL